MPIINNKLAQIIIGIKYEYNTVNRTFTLRSSGRNDKTHCQSFHSLVLFIARSKRDKKIKLGKSQKSRVSLVKCIFKVNSKDSKTKIHMETVTPTEIFLFDFER